MNRPLIFSGIVAQGSQSIALFCLGLASASGEVAAGSSGKIFWTERHQRAIYCANLDGSGGRLFHPSDAQLVQNGKMTQPPIGPIVADPIGGRIYWINHGLRGDSIVSLGLDGRDLKTLITCDSLNDALYLDTNTRELYWCENCKAKLQRPTGVTYDHIRIRKTSVDRVTVVDLPITIPAWPTRIAIDSANAKLYSLSISSLARYSLASGDREPDLAHTAGFPSNHYVWSLAFNPNRQQVFWNPTGREIEIFDVEAMKSSALISTPCTHLALDTANKRLYWVREHPKLTTTIFRADLEDTNADLDSTDSEELKISILDSTPAGSDWPLQSRIGGIALVLNEKESQSSGYISLPSVYFDGSSWSVIGLMASLPVLAMVLRLLIFRITVAGNRKTTRTFRILGSSVCATVLWIALLWITPAILIPSGKRASLYCGREQSFFAEVADGSASICGYTEDRARFWKMPTGFGFAIRDYMTVGSLKDRLGIIWPSKETTVRPVSSWSTSPQPSSYWTIIIPLWIPFGVFSIVAIILLWKALRCYPIGRCNQCGYDLRMNTSGLCPECGTPIPSEQAVRITQIPES